MEQKGVHEGPSNNHQTIVKQIFYCITTKYSIFDGFLNLPVKQIGPFGTYL